MFLHHNVLAMHIGNVLKRSISESTCCRHILSFPRIGFETPILAFIPVIYQYIIVRSCMKKIEGCIFMIILRRYMKYLYS